MNFSTNFSTNFPLPQTDREELLDLGRGTPAEVRRSLRDIRRINTYLGGARLLENDVFQILRESQMQRATILDIGSGAADIPLRLIQTGRKRGFDLQILALDTNARHLKIARQELQWLRFQDSSKIQLLQADAFHLPLRDASVDLVISSLFLHHFRAPQIVQLLREFSRVARLGFVMNDLVRSYVPLAFFRLTSPIFARSWLTRHDGAASLRRAYTIPEMTEIAAQSGLQNVEVCGHFPYRLGVVQRKVR